MIQKIKQEIRSKDLEIRKLKKDSNISNDVEELRSIGIKIDKIIDARNELEDKLFELENGGQDDNTQPLKRSAGSSIGSMQILGTYGIGQANQNEQRNGEDMKVDVFGTKEYRSAFYKNLLGQKMDDSEVRAFNDAMVAMAAEKRSDSFSNITSAAAVVPTQTINEVVSKARSMGAMISICRGFAIPSNIAIPIGTPSSAAAWHVEGATQETENVDPAKVAFTGYELMKIFSMSMATSVMSITAFEQYLIEELQNCILNAISLALVSGNGVGQGTGVLTGVTWDVSNTITYSDSAVIELDKFTKMLSMLKRGYSANAKWVMNNSMLYNTVYNMVDANGRPIFLQDLKIDEVGRILGKEVVVDDFMPDNTIVLGNFQYMGYNLPAGFILDVSRESSFKQGKIDYRAMAIADCKPLVQEAFVKMVKV